jgi:hypothetical protein
MAFFCRSKWASSGPSACDAADLGPEAFINLLPVAALPAAAIVYATPEAYSYAAEKTLLIKAFVCKAAVKRGRAAARISIAIEHVSSDGARRRRV